jgi:hypothetical protein
MTVELQRVATARRLLVELGVTLIDLVDQEPQQTGCRPGRTTFPRVIAAAGPGATRSYGTYWARMATAWGPRTLTEVAASDIEAIFDISSWWR